ncbi:hypothetical protein [Streptosporangium sandarakinum]
MSTMVQLVSQVLSPSTENACSRRAESPVMSDRMKRARTGVPS